MTLLLYYLARLQTDAVVTSQCAQLTLGDKGEVYLLDESVLPVTEKESKRKGKKSNSARMNRPTGKPLSCPQKRTSRIVM